MGILSVAAEVALMYTWGDGELCDLSHLWKVDRRADVVLSVPCDRARTEPVGPTFESLLQVTARVGGNDAISMVGTGSFEIDQRGQLAISVDQVRMAI